MLLTRPCTLILRTDSGERDRHNNPIRDEAEIETLCELQQRRRDEPGDHGELSDTLWDLFLPAGTIAETIDAINVDGQRFEFVGDPWRVRNPRTKLVSHVEATVRRTAGVEVGS